MKRFTPYLCAVVLAAIPGLAQTTPSSGSRDTTNPPAVSRGASDTPTATHGTQGPASAYPNGSANPDAATTPGAPAAASSSNPYNNDANSYNNSGDRSSHNFGWIGLIGLAGLAGLFRGNHRDDRVAPPTDVNMNPRV